MKPQYITPVVSSDHVYYMLGGIVIDEARRWSRSLGRDYAISYAIMQTVRTGLRKNQVAVI